MQKSFSIVLLLFLFSFFTSSLFAADMPKVKISDETQAYFNNFAKSCKRFSSLWTYTFQQYQTEIEVGDLNGYSGKYVKSLIEDSDCPDELKKNFKKMLNKDLFALHQYKMNTYKEDAYYLQLKGYSGSFQIAKYRDYAKDNEVEGLTVSKDVESLYEKAREQANIRKKTCSDVINVQEPLSLNKPKSQDSIGWCYAYAASDIVAHVLGREPSAVHMANLVTGKWLFKLFTVKNGGFIDTAIKEMVDKGLCLEKDLPSTDYNFSINEYKNINQVFDKVNALSEEYKSVANQQTVINELCLNHKNLLEALKELFPSLSAEQVAEILIKSSPSEAFRKLTSSCPVSRDDEVKSLKVHSMNNPDLMYPKIDEQLSAGNIIGIHYNTNVLTNYKRFGLANHASTIVGRRFNPKTLSCEYLLRNSWGKSCSGYTSDYECENGHVWIGEEFFKYSSSITEIIYAEK